MSALTELGGLLKSAIKRHLVPGASVAVVRNGRIVAAEAAGVVNLDTAVPATVDSVFQIGSITKIFTTTLVMQLAEERLLDIDAPVKTYLPEFRVADCAVAQAVTARQFLCHTSGIDGDLFVDTGYGADSVRRFVDMCTMLPNVFPPGEMMSYCNVGFSVLGRVIEVLTRRTWDEALRERIFAPLEMNHALSLPEDTLRFRSAIGHVPDPRRKGAYRVTPELFLSHGQKAAGSTPAMSASDLLKFVHVHMNGGRGANNARILTARSVAAMQRRQIKLLPNAPRAATHWGLGWFLSNWQGTRVIGHNGGTRGQAAFLRAVPDKKLAVALLTNGGDGGALYYEIFDSLMGGLAKITEPRPPGPSDAVKPEASAVCGEYRNIRSIVTIEAVRERLVATIDPIMEIGTPTIANRVPLEFADKDTAWLSYDGPPLNRTLLRFSKIEDGKAQYVAVGSRQMRRTA